MSDLSFELHYASDLAEDDVIEHLAKTLREVSSSFASDLRVLQFERDRAAIAVDVGEPGALHMAVLDKGVRRGPTYDRLVAENPLVRFPRRFGDVLLRSRARSTFLTVRFDQHTPAMRSGGNWLFSNSIGGWIGTPRVDGRPRAEWVREVCVLMSGHPAFLWGAAFDREEFKARNLQDDATGVRAIGRDVRSSLPGLFWLNSFGTPYRRLIGDSALGSISDGVVRSSAHSISVELYDDPTHWATPEAIQAHARCLERLGPQFFFDRAAPDRATSAPDFGLEELAPTPTFKVMTTDGEHFTPLPELE